jgi:3-phosphoshikimate 1-carboxyvinyltransferase
MPGAFLYTGDFISTLTIFLRYSRLMDIQLHPSGVSGSIRVPASKSQTIRALLLATFAGGVSVIYNPLDSQDTRSCIDACKAFGADIQLDDQTSSLTVMAPLSFPSSLAIDCGNSGTTLYLAMGLAATCTSAVTFTGDAQLRARPVGPLLQSLIDLGATVTYPGDNPRVGYPPFTIQGPLTGGSTEIICHTSQYLSSLLLACPLATAETRISVPLLNERPYVHLTRSWLDQQGIRYTTDLEMSRFTLQGNQQYHPFSATIAGDYSSASFFICAPAIAGGTITIEGLDPEDPQGDREILQIVKQMGCTVSWKADHAVTITSPGKGKLTGGSFDLNAIPDALPVLAATACFAQGTTVLGNVPQARIKETDRIAVMRANLSACGAQVEEREDALIIHGNGTLQGGICHGYDDHRVIMAMAIASLGCEHPLHITGIDAVGVTFPSFFTLLNTIVDTEKESVL